MPDRVDADLPDGAGVANAGEGADNEFQGQRTTLGQHREILVQAGWVALLIACVEYDTGDRAELTLEAGDTPNYYCLVLRTALAAAPRVAAALTRGGLCPDTTRWRYRGLHRQPMFSQWASPCPHADTLIGTTFQIPVHPGLTSATLRYIADAVRHAATERDDQ